MIDSQVWAHDDPTRHIQKKKERQKVFSPDGNKFESNLVCQDV